jgi:hypothetical protein
MALAKKLFYLKQLRRTHRKFGGNWLAAAKRFYGLTGPRRYSPNEVFMLGLMDPALKSSDLDRFISKESMLARQVAVNPPDLYDLTEDKLVFFQRCVDNDLPTPRVLGIWSNRTDWPVQIRVVNDDAAWRDMLTNLDVPELVIKPVHGVHGESVMLIQRDNDRFLLHSGQSLDADEILAEMRASDYSHWMIQERLYAHPDIAALTGSENLQTARVVTWIDGDGSAHVIFAWLRIIGSSEAFDNFNFGAAGNFVATIDLETAEIRYALGTAADGHGLDEIVFHPSTGRRMPGFTIPNGQQMFEMVQHAAVCFAPLRTIGWDVAITPDGFALVEGNVTWDPLPTREDLAAIAALQ